MPDATFYYFDFEKTFLFGIFMALAMSMSINSSSWRSAREQLWCFECRQRGSSAEDALLRNSLKTSIGSLHPEELLRVSQNSLAIPCLGKQPKKRQKLELPVPCIRRKRRLYLGMMPF
jgi:hypothetical protein